MSQLPIRLSAGTQFLIGVLAVLILSGCASQPRLEPGRERYAQALQRGYESLSRGEFAQALNEFSRARWWAQTWDDRPAQVRAALPLAAALEGLDQSQQALGVLEELLSSPELLDPELRLQALGRASALCLSLGRQDCARSYLDAATPLCRAGCPDFPSITLLAARLALARQALDDALVLTDQALAVLPGGSVADAAGRRAMAERANALRIKAQVRLNQRNASEAARYAQTALEIDRSLGRRPQVLADLDLLAEAEELQGNTAQAQAWRGRAVAARQAWAELGRRP